MLTIIYSIILGLVAGMIAKFIMPGRQGGGFILTTLLGIVGAVVGGILADFLKIGGGDSLLIKLAIAVGGALIVLVIYGIIFGRKRK